MLTEVLLLATGFHAGRLGHVATGARSAAPRARASAAAGVPLLEAAGIEIHYAGQEDPLLAGALVRLCAGERLALVGRNGCGKSSLLRVLAGLQTPTAGTVRRAAGLRVGYIAQDSVEALRGSAASDSVLDLVQRAVLAAGLPEECAGAEPTGAALDLARAQLLRLGFDAASSALPPSALSHGWAMRVGLACALAARPQLLLLDEPTNHVDLRTLEWLERYLSSPELGATAMAVVSHDREFVDRIATAVLNVHKGKASRYEGGYRQFVNLRRIQREALRERRARGVSVAEVAAAADAHAAGERGAAKRRARDDDDDDDDDDWEAEEAIPAWRREPKPWESARGLGVAGGARRATRPKPLRFRLKPAPSCASELGGLDGASFAYAPGAPAVLSGASLALMRGDRVGVVGDNGSGKSTMLQLLLGHLTPTAGTAGLAPRAPAAAPAAGGKGKSGGGGGLRIFYYSQNSADALDGELTLVEAVRAAEAVVQTVGPQPAAAAAPLDAAAEAEAEASIHRTLVRMQFARGTHERRVRELSGGERARLLLCALVRCRANLVVLDEPTNHLDIETVEMVEEALRYFDGTLLVASHDRFFIAQTTRTVVALSGTRDGGATADAANGGLRLFAGGWTEYTAAADAAWRGAADAAAAREADGATDAGRFVGTRAHAAKLVTIDGRYFDERGRQLSQRKDVSDKRVRTQGGLKAMKLAKRAQVGRGKMAAAAGGAGAGKAAKK